jgi:hypothetical protein
MRRPLHWSRVARGRLRFGLVSSSNRVGGLASAARGKFPYRWLHLKLAYAYALEGQDLLHCFYGDVIEPTDGKLLHRRHGRKLFLLCANTRQRGILNPLAAGIALPDIREIAPSRGTYRDPNQRVSCGFKILKRYSTVDRHRH